MKFWPIFIAMTLNIAWAAEFKIAQPHAEYVVSHLVKTVKGVSTQLKGKMVCNEGKCDFLVAIPVKSFVSSDSNRDSNMQTILEVVQYPLITVKGQLMETELQKANFVVPAKVLFHGVEKEYLISVEKKKAILHFYFAIEV